ncbi:MAG TPA: hypothetical protein VFH07_02495 [Chitinophagaceae bacterium]|nr:hypothetical protein [Chitinophagaceae bacterium]
MNFFTELKRRNELLFWFGLFNLAVAIACLILMPFEETQLLGVNRWLKPFKFYASVGIMVLTMGWLLYYLKSAKKIKLYSWLIFISMFFENGLIITQAIRNTTSHFNITSSLNGIIFQAMGFFIVVFTVTIILVCVSFFKQKQFSIPDAYVWGIRLGILFFLFFSLEGGMMLGLMKHTVGGPDGGAGLPMVNWSTQYGDLRIAHFVGIHSLQALPLFGYYILKTKTQTILFSAVYFLVASGLFLQAMNGIPLFF